MVCACSVAKTAGGWTLRDDGLWVCGNCGLPSAMYLKAWVEMADKELPTGTHLNLLRFGPLHHRILTNPELLDRRDMMLNADWAEIEPHLTGYRWTHEIVVGQSGKRARVWVWKDEPE